MILSRQQKLILLVAISLVALVVFVRWVIFPLFDRVRVASQEYLTGQESLAKLDQRELLFKELEEDYQARQDDLADIEGIFLDEQEAVGFISTLETIAAQTGNVFEIKTAGYFTASNQDEESYLTLRISLWGNFSNILTFLANLEDSPYPPYRLIEIENLTMRGLDKEGLEQGVAGELEVVVSIKIYTQ